LRWSSFFRKARTSMLGLLLSGSWWRRAGPVRLRPSFTGLPTRPESMFHCNSRSHSTTSIMLPTTGLTAVTTTRPWRNRHLQGISPKANPATTSPIFNPAFCSSATLPVNFTATKKVLSAGVAILPAEGFLSKHSFCSSSVRNSISSSATTSRTRR